jgi:Peptidase A4 family
MREVPGEPAFTGTGRGRRPWRGRSRVLMAVLAAAVVSACGSSGGPAGGGTGNGSMQDGGSPATHAAPMDSAAPTPTPTPPPFPQVGAITRTAGTTSLTSQHWVGYTFPVNNVTGVRAEWTEPSVQGSPNDEEFVWIGVGGWDQTDDNIVQDGTFVYYPPGGAGSKNEGMWYEQVPPINGEAKFPGSIVEPGDHIYASVTRLNGGEWRVSVDDVTAASSFAVNLHFHSMESYPSFVVEDPDNGPAGPAGPFFPFPHWGSVTISNMQVRIGGGWVSAARLYGYRIDMVRGGSVLARAGSLSGNSSFYAIQR